ncbi:MAG: hypothetical protein NC300_10055 [Bacteroidales bacterium]|nr:hypothetical protein [Clostridium sp.]MCM1204473.1 hypothetical protein [Bacteroidales bacterium]
MKNKVIEIANEKGYDIQFENNHIFYIIQDNIVYSYKCTLKKVSLVKIYTEMEPITDIKIKGNKGKITITIIGKDEFDVALQDSVIEINNQGKEMIIDENIHFVCSAGFTLESINQNDMVTQMGKAEKNYNRITHNYISGNKLLELYEEGEVIADELEAELN